MNRYLVVLYYQSEKLQKKKDMAKENAKLEKIRQQMIEKQIEIEKKTKNTQN